MNIEFREGDDGPRGIAEQMTWDERLLEVAASGVASPPVLRRYVWPGGDDRWASIGYFQKPALVPLDLRGRWARRPTGGGLVLHEGALTWSLVFPVLSGNGGRGQAPPLRTTKPGSLPGSSYAVRAIEVYRMVHGAVGAALASLGVDATLAPATASGRGGVCAVTLGPCDVLVGGRKVAGGAQRRRLGAVLYQGYIDLGGLGLPSDRVWEELVKAVGVVA